MTKNLAIYVHWPWCKAKCPYCDFNSHASAVHEEDYVAALGREAAFWRDRLAAGRTVNSIFVGGGTPSLMQPASVAKVLDFCAQMGTLAADCEVTVECNPTSSSDTLFAGLKAAGVSRISVGIQGLKDDWLRFLGREHSVDEALRTLDAAQAHFSNVNADVIYGLPGQELAAWNAQLQVLAGRGLAHISAYQLTVEQNTAFFSQVKRGEWQPVDNDTEADFFASTRQVLAENGYENYEISNFSKPGMACRHNVHVWEYGDYVGLGAGAHGRVVMADGTRVATACVRAPEAYMARAGVGEGVFATWETVDGARGAWEAFFMGLRLLMGVDVDWVVKTFGIDAYKAAIDEDACVALTAAGLLENSADGRLRLSLEGWPRLNGVLGRILRR